MTDLPLVHKRLAIIEGCIADLRSIDDPAAIEVDVRTERFAEHTLQIAIQAALDVAAHIVGDDALGEPASNRDLFTLIARHGWVPQADIPTLSAMAGFRNLIVHGYADVDTAVVRAVVEENLDDLEAFVAAIRAHLPVA